MQSLTANEQVNIALMFANKTTNQAIDIFELSMSEVETVLNDFGNQLRIYFESRSTPPKFWQWGDTE